MYSVNEKDWKLYNEKLPLWQERFIKERLKYYSSILDEIDSPSFKYKYIYFYRENNSVMVS